MRHSRVVPILIAAVVLSLALMGCGLVSPTLRILTLTNATQQPRIVEQDVVASPTAEGQEAASAASAAPATPVPATSIQIVPGADVESQILVAVYKKVNPSVVYIENLTQANSSSGATPSDQMVPESEASGFVWDTQGHIVTNNHVVEGADQLLVTFSDGVLLPAEIVGTDPDSDLAVIKVDPKLATLAPVEQGDITKVAVGQRAIAIGNPFGLVGTMTSGIVSAIGRSIPAITQYQIPESIQTDAAINPGNSGGPLLNDQGQVIGVNAQIQSSTRSNAGVGFAIPINIVQRVVPSLIKTGTYTHAWLGISGRTYSPAWAKALGYPEKARGAYVMTVTRGGPADKGGLHAASEPTDIILGMDVAGPAYLEKGGDLIVGIDNQPVITFDDLLTYLESFKSPGDQVSLKVLRTDGSQQTLTVTLGTRPKNASQ